MAAAISLAPAAHAVDLKFSHAYTDGDMRDLWAEHIAEQVAEKTNGDVTIEVYPNQQLFKAKAQHQALERDRIDLAIYPLPWLSGMAPLAEIGALPGLVTTPQDGVVWRERAIWPMLEEAVASTGVVLGGGGWAMATIGNTGEPILMPSDMAGHKMRGLGKATETMMADNGATITSLPASEIYQALQTGVLTGVLTQYASFSGYNLDEVIDHLLVGKGFIGGFHAVLVAPGVEKKLGPDGYAALMEAIAESESWFADEASKETETVAAAFEAKGVKIHRLTDEQVAAWKDDARKTAWVYFTETVPNGKEALEAIEQPR
jgi:TRAP-type C4-dicarboxylate transport system substrate-binding protein